MAEQLTFNLPVRESRSRGDFFVSDANALALARLDAPETWPNNKLVLVGPDGAGKTHLAHVWAEEVGARMVGTTDLVSLDVTSVDQPVVCDDVQRLSAAQEEALFHLHNHLGASGLPFLLTSREAPARWEVSLPDLRSRMAATDSVRIDTPDDALLSAVLVKQFADRQLAVSPTVVAWLVGHMERSFAEGQRIVEALDAASLSEGRAITRPLAQRVLEQSGRETP